jgi:outer membrane protein OmpA-like peptidoglycan-associated protein
MDDARMVLRSARAATADLAENMEALKRNWFFRGFYTNRGFYDLDSVTVDEYLQGKLAPERAREREWLHEGEVFTTGPNGEEMLSEAGRKRLDKVIAPYLRHAPNTLLIIEGYSSQGSEDERFLRSRDRAEMVRHYLIDRFGLKPTYVGTMPMGGVKSESGEFFDGLGVVYFPEEASNKR